MLAFHGVATRAGGSSTVLKAGDQIGSYRIVEPLQAEGGMARLFLGRRVGAAGFARPVAIKVVHPHLASDPRFIRMFIDEALLSARITHPNVVHVEELGEIDGTYFLVMEYVPGCSLAHLTQALSKQGRKLALDLAMAISIQIADGLHAAHETRGDDRELLGVVHQDVSPQNILLSYQGHIKLIDFGVARARGQLNANDNLLQGKYRYMAPEQARHEGVDRRSDVYALGIVLWEMLAGVKLFHAPDPKKLRALVSHPSVVPPSTFAPEVPSAVDAVVLAALAPDPADRPATAQEFRERLVAAAPGALAFGPPQLAKLLDAVIGVQLARLYRTHPDALPEVTAELTPAVVTGASHPATEEILGTLTVVARRNPAAPSVAAIEPTGTAAGTPVRRRASAALALAGVALLSASAAVIGSQRGSARPMAAAAPTTEAPGAVASGAVASGAPAQVIGAPTANRTPPGPVAAEGSASDTLAPDAGAVEAVAVPSPRSAGRNARRRTSVRHAPHRRTTGHGGVPLVRDLGI